MDKLVGGSVDEIPEVYAERSAVNNAQNIRSPLLVSELDRHRLYFVVGAASTLDSY